MKKYKHQKAVTGIDRRSFMKGALAAGTVTALSPHLLHGQIPPPSAKVNVACCGIGGRGTDDIIGLERTGLANIVALCDTDMGSRPTQRTLNSYPDVPRFQDFRKMFDKMGKDIDAVMIATPDFSHFPIAMHAMSLGKHVYCEKPIAESYLQLDLLMKAEKKYNVAAQMGNQGHSEANYFQFKSWVDAGIVKNVTKITAFMNSARRWHGMEFSDYLPEQPIPETLDWDCWLATTKELRYNFGYTVGEWRSWYDLGNGALGDWGAHIFDTAHEFLELGLPTEIEAVKLEGHSNFIFPQSSTLAFRFPTRGSKPPVELTWYDGIKNLPPLPDDFGGNIVDPNIPPPTRGSIDTQNLAPGKVIYGEDLTFKGGTHGSTLSIIPQEKAADMASKLPEVPKSTSDHYKNFLLACMGEEKTRSPFAVSGPLCQMMALGVIAQRLNAKLTFDPATEKVTNNKVANELLAGVPPRKEWEQYYKL
ncbi:Gfo/Idh/MocA family oxidoreductase [Candidatus Latescibacterota bacterium]